MELIYNYMEVDVPGFIPESCTPWVEQMFLDEELEPGDFNVIFCSDEYLYRMNLEYLKHDYYTDIITFDYSEEDVASGDLFISVERVADNAAQLNISFLNELYRVIIHGFLHLAGYKDKKDADKLKMTEKENYYLAKLNISE